MNLPNRLTLLRVAMIPFFLVFYLIPIFGPADHWIALAIFCLASLTNLLDGRIARSRNLVTNFGKLMDPLADKLLVCAALVAMTAVGRLNVWVVVVIVSREFLVSGLRELALERHVVIAASGWGKLKTVTQMVMVIYILLDLTGWPYDVIGVALVTLATLFTILSAADYIWKNRELLKG